MDMIYILQWYPVLRSKTIRYKNSFKHVSFKFYILLLL